IVGVGWTMITVVRVALPGLAAMPWIDGSLRLLAVIVNVNYALAVFNLIPFGPLDGQKILSGLTPRKWHRAVQVTTLLCGVVWLWWRALGGMGGALSKAVTRPQDHVVLFQLHEPYIAALVALGVAAWLAVLIPSLIHRARARRWFRSTLPGGSTVTIRTF